MLDSNKENKALQQASKLAFDEIESAFLGSAEAREAEKPKENSNGSFERFMAMMGSLEQRGKTL